MNKVVLLGRLVRDLDISYTQSQKVVAKFMLAVDRPFPGPDGKKEADFIPVVVWGKGAELIGNSCAKGHRLLVEGRIQIRNYEDKDGNKKWVTEVICNNFEFVERRNSSNDGTASASGLSKEDAFNRELAQAEKEARAALEDDVPF